MHNCLSCFKCLAVAQATNLAPVMVLLPNYKCVQCGILQQVKHIQIEHVYVIWSANCGSFFDNITVPPTSPCTLIICHETLVSLHLLIISGYEVTSAHLTRFIYLLL